MTYPFKTILSEIKLETIICFLLLPLMFSCVSARKEVDQNVAFEKKKKVIISSIHGGWLSKKYMQEVLENNSVYKAMHESSHNIQLIIDTSRASSDTIVNPGSYINDHESDYFQIVFEHDSVEILKSHLIYTLSHPWRDDYYVDLKFSGKDTILLLTTYDSLNQEIISTAEFQRVYKNPPANDYHIGPAEAFFAKTFFNGKYKLLDDKGTFISDVFIDYATVKGFYNYHSYHVYHYKNSQECNGCDFDYIIFYDNDRREYFHWVKKNEGLEFYEVKYSPEVTKIGPLRYRLVHR